VTLWLVFLLIWKGLGALFTAIASRRPKYPEPRRRIDPTL